MPRSFNQKLKILYLMKAFEEKTDREHPISVAEIIKYMDSYGISVERKAVYDDIETLRVLSLIHICPSPKADSAKEKPRCSAREVRFTVSCRILTFSSRA